MYQRLIAEIIDHVRAKAPHDWRQIDLIYIAVGRSIEMKIGVDTAEGPIPGIGGPIGIPRAVDELRDLILQPDFVIDDAAGQGAGSGAATA
ncbi:hypothetical protein [Nocardia sp. CC227C]|uniref:hypothetical protein n=1 Tax=Nocardia sp. CC227C TaxID=3044562 RepID=UPI00278BB1D5|nr:hypothetical protein [Nocardia sp. CC227C]